MLNTLTVSVLGLLMSAAVVSAENSAEPSDGASVKKVLPTIHLESLSQKLEDRQIIVERDDELAVEKEIANVKHKAQNPELARSFGFGRCENMCSTSTCNSYCLLDLAPGEPDIRTCQDYYRYFGHGQNIWTTTYGQQVCHLDDDVDFWSFEIDFEFYVSDRRVRKCNNNIISNRKREVAQISCSFYTGIFNESRCARRIENKFQQLGAQGIFPHPNLFAANGDPRNVCP